MTNSIKQNQWHTVVDSENILLIAKQAGFRSWQTVFNHPKNEDFRQNNPDPYVTRTGDQVWIPKKNPHKGFLCNVGTTNRFVVKTLKSLFHLVMEDEDGIPYVGKNFEILINGQVYGDKERRTSNDGLVSAEVLVSSEFELRIWFEGEANSPTIYTVKTGALDPIDTIEGVQDRLNNLGYDCIGEDGKIGLKTKAALKEFQTDFDLATTGEIDSATLEKLQAEHDINK